MVSSGISREMRETPDSRRHTGALDTPDAIRPRFRPRKLSFEAGRGIEILGHAIQYLEDEYQHEGGTFSGSDSQMQAREILMRLNREIYLECPPLPMAWERIRRLFFR